MSNLSIYRHADANAREIESLRRENERLREQVAELTGQRAGLLPYDETRCVKCSGTDNRVRNRVRYVPARKAFLWRAARVEHFTFRCHWCGASYRMHVHGARP